MPQPKTFLERQTRPHFIGEQTEFRDKWKDHHSGIARYARADLFDGDIIGRAKRLTEETVLEKIWRFSVPIAAVVFAAIAIVLAIAGIDAPTFDGSTESATAIVLYVLSFFGLGDFLFGQDYILTAIVAILIGLAFQYNLTREVRKSLQRYVDVVEFFEKRLYFARQIFVGTGNLQFSFGSEGFYVNGDVLDMRMNWKVFWGKEFVRKTVPENHDADNKESVIEGADPENATHMLIYMKPGDESQAPLKNQLPQIVFIVVPRSRFFTDQLGSDDWKAFCQALDQHVGTI